MLFLRYICSPPFSLVSFSGQLSLDLSAANTIREGSYSVVGQLAMAAWVNESDFRSAVEANPDPGETEAEALEMTADFLVCVIADFIDSGEPLPEPKKRTGKKYRSVPLPALASVKAKLYRAFLTSGVRKAELARRLGMAKGNLDRLFDSTHSTRLEHLEAAFLAIGKRLDIGIREAA